MLPDRADVESSGEDDVWIRVGEKGPRARFHVVPVDQLTRAWLESADHTAALARRRPLVLYGKATGDARAALREQGVSYVGLQDGRMYVLGPGLHLEREELRRSATPSYWLVDERRQPRNPYALGASRVPRWLLLHPHEHFTVKQLAAATDLSESAASRTVQALDDGALVETIVAEHDARMRHVRVKRPRSLLSAWAPAWERRRIESATWDVGAHDADEAVRLLRTAAGDEGEPRWAVGGLAGAAQMARAAEPADVLVWIEPDAIDRLAERLRPRLHQRGRGRGTLRVAVMPDPWVIGLAQRFGRLPVADPVQLWLDCATEGERSLEAAEAVAGVMDW